MADNSTQTGSDLIADDHVSTLNGAAITPSASTPKVQRAKVMFGDPGTARDVSTNFPLPMTMVSTGGQTLVLGSITAAGANNPGTASTAATAGQVVASTALSGNATFHIVTSAFVGTLSFEGSVDGGLNYAPILAVREDGTGADSTLAISTAAYFIRQYTVALPGLAYFRVRASAFTSGSVAIIIAPGPTLIEPSPSLAAGAAQIGTIGELRASTLAVTATAALTTAATATLPAPGAGLFHYITSIQIVAYSAAARTGSATPWVVTSTNLPGSPAWTFSSAGAIGTNEMQTVEPSTPLKSSVANTATTIVGPAATSVIWRINVVYFVAA